MPLIAHTLAGMVAASAVASTERRESRSWKALPALGMTFPLAVLFAYLPDIVSQALLFAGNRDGRLVGHSLPVACILEAIGFWLLRRFGFSNKSAAVLPLAGLMSHLALDFLQSPDHLAWWPLAIRQKLPEALLPAGPSGEAIAAAGLLLIWGAFRWRRQSVVSGGEPIERPTMTLFRLAPALLTAGIAAAAVTVFFLREARERELEQARQLIEAGRVEDGFFLLDSADRWPATSKPGRVDYFRGVSHLKRGRYDQAEAFFLRAYRDDPRYFWVVYDLADFYARSPRPLEERRSLAAPFLRSLAEDFAGNPEARKRLAQLEERLGRTEDR